MKKVVFIILFALIAWGGYRWRESQEWDHRVEVIRKHLGQGHRGEASAALDGLLDERADDPEALRLVVRMAITEDPRKALELLHRLRASNQATWQDSALLVEITQDYPDISPESTILAQLAKAHGEKPEIGALLARQEFLEGRVDRALGRLTEALEKAPDNRSLRLQQARILLLSQELAMRLGAKVELFELGEGNDLVGHKALRILVDREIGPTFFPADALEASIALQRHSLTGNATFLRATSLRLKLELDQRDEILASAVERVGVTDKVLLAVWLNGELAPTLTLETLSLEESVADEKKFLPLFQALLLLKKLPEAHRLRSEADGFLGDSAKIRADAFLELAEGKRDGALERFVRNAATFGDQQSLVDAGRLALLAGHGKASWNAYLQALESGGEGIGQPVGLQLLQLALHRRETEVAWRTAKLLAERFSRRSGNQNNYAYLSLLLNREVPAATQAAEEAVKVGPRNTAFLSTLALARFRAGRLKEALELMERRGTNGLTPGERSAKAAIFLGLERKADAVSVVRGLRPEMMLPEEWSLLGEVAVGAPPTP